MTRTFLLEDLRDFTKAAIKELLMPIKEQKGDAEQACRAAQVYLMRLPDGTSATKKAPYILHQLITGKDNQVSGSRVESSAVVRSIFCVYNNDEQEGACTLLNLMERLRIALLKEIVIGEQFKLDLESGVETLIYPDDTAPYYAGEMITTWKLPAIEREVSL